MYQCTHKHVLNHFSFVIRQAVWLAAHSYTVGSLTEVYGLSEPGQWRKVSGLVREDVQVVLEIFEHSSRNSFLSAIAKAARTASIHFIRRLMVVNLPCFSQLQYICKTSWSISPPLLVTSKNPYYLLSSFEPEIGNKMSSLSLCD